MFHNSIEKCVLYKWNINNYDYESEIFFAVMIIICLSNTFFYAKILFLGKSNVKVASYLISPERVV